MTRRPTLVGSAIVVALILVAEAASAQTITPTPLPAANARTIELTLDDAVRRAIDNNPDLVVVRLERDVETARTAQTRAAYVPMFSTTLGRSSIVTPPSTLLSGEQGVDVDDWFASSGFRGRAPWAAGAWSVTWDTARTTTNSPITSFDPSLQSGMLFAYSQPLLRDRSGLGARQARDDGYAEHRLEAVHLVGRKAARCDAHKPQAPAHRDALAVEPTQELAMHRE